MRFEWDERKNEQNIRRHGIDFADVRSLFLGPRLTDLDDREDYGEDRWISIGMIANGVAVVIWAERQGDVIRIISARKANKSEHARYEDYLKDELGTFGGDEG